MKANLCYNTNEYLDNDGLLTQADNHDMNRSLSWGASVSLAIPAFPSRGGIG